MKIQCSCGAKFEFEITSEMAKSPVKFVCSSCGRESSDFVDSLVRQQLGQGVSPTGSPFDISGVARLTAAATPKPALRVQGYSAPQAVPIPEPLEQEARCSKHPGQLAIEKCYVCS